MKTVFVIFFIVCLNAYGQDFESLKSGIKILTENRKFVLDSTGLYQLPKVDVSCMKMDIPVNINLWHVEDLNNDGKNDLIYSGLCSPYDLTAIYLNSNSGLKLVEEIGGKLVSIKKENKKTIINVLAPSCCCEYFSYLKEVIIDEKSNISISNISFHFKTNIESFNKFEFEKLSGIIRSSHNVDNVIIKDPCRDDAIIIGNQIETIRNKLVAVISTYNNWKLVASEKKKNNFVVGWIKTN